MWRIILCEMDRISWITKYMGAFGAFRMPWKVERILCSTLKGTRKGFTRQVWFIIVSCLVSNWQIVLFILSLTSCTTTYYITFQETLSRSSSRSKNKIWTKLWNSRQNMSTAMYVRGKLAPLFVNAHFKANMFQDISSRYIINIGRGIFRKVGP